MHKALFLDRDGVINEDRDYVCERSDFVFCEGIFDLCVRARDAGFRIVVITNQSGIARGLYSESQLADLHRWMRDQFRCRNVDIAGIYYCPHHPDVGGEKYRRDCDCRKPRPGMILAAARELDLDLANSTLVGDKPTDMQAAKAAGVGRRILLQPESAQQRGNANDATEIAPALDRVRP